MLEVTLTLSQCQVNVAPSCAGGTERCKVLAEVTASWCRGQGDMSVPGHRWWQLCYPGVTCSTRLQWHQAAGREVTLRWGRVAGTDGTAHVELVQGAGGSAHGGEVTLPSHKLSLACQRSAGAGGSWGQGGDTASGEGAHLEAGR